MKYTEEHMIPGFAFKYGGYEYTILLTRDNQVNLEYRYKNELKTFWHSISDIVSSLNAGQYIPSKTPTYDIF